MSGDPARLGEAEAGYREALAIDPDHENALWGLANTLVAVGRRDDAVALLRRHIESHPMSTRGYARLGDLLSEPGPSGRPIDPAEAERLYRKAVSLNPEESGGYVNLGRLLYRKGDLDEAEAQFRSALKINFKSLVAARHLALIACRRGDPATAAGEIAPVLERFLADKPKLHALSEGDTLGGNEKLTPAAREVFPAVELLRAIVQSGAAPPGIIPPEARALELEPLPGARSDDHPECRPD
jgi:tetratricopeptide (TPR) repeat protein